MKPLIAATLLAIFIGSVLAIPTTNVSCTSKAQSHLSVWADVAYNMIRHTPWHQWPIRWSGSWQNAVKEYCSQLKAPVQSVEESRNHFPGSSRSWSWLSDDQWKQLLQGSFVRVPRDTDSDEDVTVFENPYKEETDSDEKSDQDSDIEIYYQVHGHGPRKILFMTGFICPHSTWLAQIKHYSSPEMASQYQICIYDHRGVGFSSSPVPAQGEKGYKTSDMARDALYLVRQLKWDQFHLVGYSLGGMVAQELALAHPRMIQSLTLVSTHTGRMQMPFEGLMKTVSCLCTLTSPFHILSEVSFPPEYLALKPEDPEEAAKYPTNREKYYQLLEHFYRISPPHSALGIYSQLMSIHTHSMSRANLLHLRHIPTQVILSTRDHLIPPESTRRLANLLKAPVIIFKGSGHVIHLERSDEFHQVLEAHVNAHHDRKMEMPMPLSDDEDDGIELDESEMNEEDLSEEEETEEEMSEEVSEDEVTEEEEDPSVQMAALSF